MQKPQPPYTTPGQIKLYTDGGASTNPGPGGYGAVLLSDNHKKELSQGFKLTTNNRMELLACIEGLNSLKQPSPVTLYSDSKYVVDAINKGWLKKWVKNGWKLSSKKPVENKDLWERFLVQLDKHQVTLKWVKGHSGDYFNEVCDQLATEAYNQPDLLTDIGFESRSTPQLLSLFD